MLAEAAPRAATGPAREWIAAWGPRRHQGHLDPVRTPAGAGAVGPQAIAAQDRVGDIAAQRIVPAFAEAGGVGVSGNRRFAERLEGLLRIASGDRRGRRATLFPHWQHPPFLEHCTNLCGTAQIGTPQPPRPIDRTRYSC